MKSQSTKIWVIVPSAGSGQRMRQSIPKQYLPLNGKTVIEITLATLFSNASINKIIICCAANDEHWPSLACANDERVETVIGGETRAHSVLNGLMSLQSRASDDDWVLVHDAARPCLTAQTLQSLIEQLSGDEVGGILAVKSNDTVKLAAKDKLSDVQIDRTLNRDEIWYAQTPQMFRYGLLKNALQQALESELLITDEASAMEMAGYHPRLIEGERSNFKITQPEDLKMAELVWQSLE